MKKYIKPVSQMVEMDMENVMLVNSLNNEIGDGLMQAKRRNQITGDEWDFEEENEF